MADETTTALPNGHLPIEDWSGIPTITDDTPPVPMPEELANDPRRKSTPDGRAPTPFEGHSLEKLDRELQENHQDKQRVAGSIYQLIVVKDEKGAEQLMERWRALCDKELQLAMRAFTLQAFSKHMVGEERKEPHLSGVSELAMGVGSKEHKPVITIGRDVEGSK